MTAPVASRQAAVTRRGAMPNPCVLPVGTRAIVKGSDSSDLEGVGVKAIMVNAFHLSQRPGISVVNSAGGVHRFMGWKRTLWTDSGGFQLFSLIRENDANGQVTDKGFAYLPPDGGGRELFTPVKAITNQWRLGADVFFCLDQCTHPSDPPPAQEESVARTISWARACNDEFAKRQASAHADEGARPLLFGVIQGGTDVHLRRRCADALLEIGFDGFGFGGWPINDEGGLVDMVACVVPVPSAVGFHVRHDDRSPLKWQEFHANRNRFEALLDGPPDGRATGLDTARKRLHRVVALRGRRRNVVSPDPLPALEAWLADPRRRAVAWSCLDRWPDVARDLAEAAGGHPERLAPRDAARYARALLLTEGAMSADWVLERALAVHRDDPNLLMERLWTRCAQGRPDDALDHLAVAAPDIESHSALLYLRRHTEQAHLARAAAYRLQGSPGAAWRDYAAALAQNPRSRQARDGLFDQIAEASRQDTAISMDI